MITGEAVMVTDTYGRVVLAEPEHEPEPGSVVLINGIGGTAWQRLHNDGLWHSTRRGRAITWTEVLARRNVLLIHEVVES